MYSTRQIASLLLVPVLLGGCIYLPKTTEAYSAECNTNIKHMTLTSEQVGAFVVCNHEACAALLLLAGVVSATSAVVSGSIVVIGKAVYWLEKQINCKDPLKMQEAPEH
jgi:hypothetical protein